MTSPETEPAQGAVTVEKVQRADGRPSVCLTMIVKDEAHVIRRCLDSVRPLIDAWSIVDTGSRDGTQPIIREALADLPGMLHERAWRDFGHNRTEALELARPWADYALVIDADETLEMPPDFRLPPLRADAYHTPHRDRTSSTSFYRVQLVRCATPWRYVGVLHEVIQCDEPHDSGRIDGLACVGHFDSARNLLDPKEKYARDAAVLAKALEDEPENTRYVFYLAQSYRDAGQIEAAIATYRRRAAMGGWAEEVWYSLYQVGRLEARRDHFSAALEAHLAAYQARPTRAEPLCELARLYRLRNEFQPAYLFARRAAEIPRPEDLLFLDDSVYTWRAVDELSIAAYWVGHYREARATAERLLAGGALPATERDRVEKNRAFAVDKLAATKPARSGGKPRSSGKARAQQRRKGRRDKRGRKR